MNRRGARALRSARSSRVWTSSSTRRMEAGRSFAISPTPAQSSGALGPHGLNPLAPPGRLLERIREILCLVHDLTVAELHNAHGVCRSPLVGDGVFRDPEITFSENSLDVEARRL